MTQLALTLPDRACRGCGRPLDDPGLCRLCVAGLSVCDGCEAEFPSGEAVLIGYAAWGKGRDPGRLLCP